MLIGREKEQYILRQAFAGGSIQIRCCIWEKACRKDLFNTGNIWLHFYVSAFWVGIILGETKNILFALLTRNISKQVKTDRHQLHQPLVGPASG